MSAMRLVLDNPLNSPRLTMMVSSSARFVSFRQIVAGRAILCAFRTVLTRRSRMVAHRQVAWISAQDELGTVRSETLRGFMAAEMEKLLAKVD
jgi:hypothetical protein